MDLNKIRDSLHPLERKILPLLPKYNSIPALIKESGLKEVEVTRALQWLRNKELAELKEEVREVIALDKNGESYSKLGLPERRFLNVLNREMSIKDVEKASKLSKEEISVCLGLLKKKAAINISKRGNDLFVSLTDPGRNLLKKDMLEEKFLKKIFPIDKNTLSGEDLFAFNELVKRRNIIKSEAQKTKTAHLTGLGNELISSSKDFNTEVIDVLTQDILKARAWQNKGFRAYDIQTQVPRISYGKKHFENEAIEYAKSVWVNMGFKEMKGTFVQSAFWDLDVLFVPQDHPAREMQDTFYLKKPSTGKLPEELKKKVKAVHENGADTGSKGWGGSWDENLARKLMLRTHTTAVSARTISKLRKQDLPLKFFSINKVFRNETPDWKHLFEFYQAEGIVVDPNATFNDLKGYLQEFFMKMGYEKIKLRPGHFPYTEPSIEVEVYDEKKQQWVELGGAGIFRPEVTKTLMGFECPVLAWGLGLGRIVVPYYKIGDLREFNRNDIKQLRRMKKWTLQPR